VAHHLTDDTIDFFDNKIDEWNDSIYKKSSYMLLKKTLPLKEDIKDRLSFFSYYYRGVLRKKITNKYISIPISKYARLKHIPLNKLIVQYRDAVYFKAFFNGFVKDFIKIFNLLNNDILSYKIARKYWLPYYKSLVNKLKVLYLNFMRYNSKANRLFFFKRVFNYNIYKHKIGYKNKIPTYN